MSSNLVSGGASVTPLLLWPLLFLLAATSLGPQNVHAQGVKGIGSGSSSFSSSLNSLPISSGGAGQLSSSFVQMFNSLTPAQQQQFIRQMSSSNRRVFQQAIQPQTSSNFFEEEVNSSGPSSGSTGAGISTSLATSGLNSGATKSALFKQQQQFLSPAQQATFFKSSKQSSSSFVQPTVQPVTQFSFSRQVSQNSQVPQQIILPSSNSESSFQRSFQTSSIQPQPQQQSLFNQVQRVQQVAPQVVLPASEQSFRRVQSFSSQPLTLPGTGSQESAFSQFVQQQSVEPQPQKQSSLSRFQQSSFASGAQPVSSTFNQFSSSSSNLAGGGLDSSTASGLGAFGSSVLQQEKLDTAGIGGGLDANSLTQQTFVPGSSGASSSSIESSQNSLFGGSGLASGGFDSSDGQQKNFGIPDDIYGGLTAASINNKWYIMRPVDNPSALGLGDARSASGSLRQLPLSRTLLQQQKSGKQVGAVSAQSRSGSAIATTAATKPASVTTNPKKRGASTSTTTSSNNNKKKRREDDESSGANEESSNSASSNSDEANDVDEGANADEDTRKR